MPTPSPICTVNGSAPPQDVTAGSTVTIALANTAGVQIWSIAATSTDDLNTPGAISLSVNQGAKTATFTAPATGSAVIFTSIVGTTGGLGKDVNGVAQPTYQITFKVNVKTMGGQRVLATSESVEQGAPGWIIVFNALARAAAAAGITAGAVSGAGLWHSTASVLDATAYKGTADQLLVTNHAATDTAWITLGGDASYASGSLTVVGLQTRAVSSTAPTSGQVLTWSGTAWAPATPATSSSALTSFGADLAGSAATQQWIASISGSGGAGGVVPVNATTLQFAASQASPGVSQATSTSGAGQALSITAQTAKATSGGAGGNLQLITGAGDGLGAAGQIVGKVAATQVLSLGAASSDFLRFGATTAGSGIIRAPNNVVVLAARNAGNTADLGLIATDGSNDMLFGSTSQGAATFLQGPSGGSVNLTVGGVTSFTATSSFTTLEVNGTSYLNLTASQIQPQVQTISWASGVATPTITQAQATGNVPASSLVLAPQQPSSGASGINLNGTHVIVSLPASSTKAGTFRVTQNGSVVASFAPNGLVQGTPFQSLWLGSTVGSESATNFAVASDGSTATIVNGPSSTQLQVANTTWLTVTSSNVTVGTNVLAFTAAATAPAFGQLGAVSNVAPQNLTISPQAAFSGATGTNRNGTTVVLALPAATNSGTVGGTVRITQAGNGVASFGPNGLIQATPFQAIWMGTAVGAESSTNYTLVADGASNTGLNAPTELLLQVAGTPEFTLSSSGGQLFAGGNTQQLGSGVGVLGITNAGTDPSANPSGGGILFESAIFTALTHRGSGGATYALAGTGSGTINTHTARKLRQMFFGHSASSAPITLATIAIPSGTAAYVEAEVVIRDLVTIANSFGGKSSAVVYNSGGTVTVKSSTNIAGAAMTFVASSGNVLIQTTASTGNSSDHQAEVTWQIC